MSKSKESRYDGGQFALILAICRAFQPMRSSDELKALTAAVEKLHGAKARFISSVPVHEQFDGVTVWQGVVSHFELNGHPTAALCYAWSVPATGDRRERFVAVLHTPEVDSADKAVRAAMVAEHRKK